MKSELQTILETTYFGEPVVDGFGNRVSVSEYFDGFSDDAILFYNTSENFYNVIDPSDRMVYALDGRDDTFGEILYPDTASFDKYMLI